MHQAGSGSRRVLRVLGVCPPSLRQSLRPVQQLLRQDHPIPTARAHRGNVDPQRSASPWTLQTQQDATDAANPVRQDGSGLRSQPGAQYYIDTMLASIHLWWRADSICNEPVRSTRNTPTADVNAT